MKDIMNSNVIKVSVALLSLYVISSFYKKYQKDENDNELENNNLIINDYLLEDIKSNKLKKPILWIHIPYKKNSRNWDSFYSRTNENINQDYIYLCVKSIIDKCGKSFHVCVIDDNSFQKILPNWNIDMTIIDEPILGYMRTLGLMKLIYNYGGMLVPYSFVCYKDLIQLYNDNSKAFFGEFVDNTIVTNHTLLYPNYKFMGSNRMNPVIDQIIKSIEITIHNNTTDEINFNNSINKLIYEKINSSDANMIDSKYLGVKTSNNKIVTVELLFSEKIITFNKDIFGVYLPYDKILEMYNYSWFSKLSYDECINTNYNISFILKKSVNQYL
tara:strand:+ start:2778 stop:3764 length:987 start_codon:yes stop_codon:yes gene_type:complete